MSESPIPPIEVVGTASITDEVREGTMSPQFGSSSTLEVMLDQLGL